MDKQINYNNNLTSKTQRLQQFGNRKPQNTNEQIYHESENDSYYSQSLQNNRNAEPASPISTIIQPQRQMMNLQPPQANDEQLRFQNKNNQNQQYKLDFANGGNLGRKPQLVSQTQNDYQNQQRNQLQNNMIYNENCSDQRNTIDNQIQNIDQNLISKQKQLQSRNMQDIQDNGGLGVSATKITPQQQQILDQRARRLNQKQTNQAQTSVGTSNQAQYPSIDIVSHISSQTVTKNSVISEQSTNIGQNGLQQQASMVSINTIQSSNQEMFVFKKDLLQILSKFGKIHTQQQAAEECKKLMTSDITDNDKMNCFLTLLIELNEHMNVNQMKEQIKQFGVAAEIFEDALVPFVPKMLANFQKKIKEEGSNRLHQSISETIGQLVWNIVDKVEESELQQSLIEQQFLKLPFSILEKSTSKLHQCAAISCLTKIVINCPEQILHQKLDLITDKIIATFEKKSFQAHQNLLECLISIIFHIQEEFRFYYNKFLPILQNIIKTTKDVGTKRVAIDAIYSIGAHLSQEILQHKEELLNILEKSRADKCQPVRAAAQETIKLLKELDQLKSQDGQNLSQNDEELDNPDCEIHNDINLQNDQQNLEDEIMKEQQENHFKKIRQTQQNLYPSFADVKTTEEATNRKLIQQKQNSSRSKSRSFSPNIQNEYISNNKEDISKPLIQSQVAKQKLVRCKSPNLNLTHQKIVNTEKQKTQRKTLSQMRDLNIDDEQELSSNELLQQQQQKKYQVNINQNQSKAGIRKDSVNFSQLKSKKNNDFNSTKEALHMETTQNKSPYLKQKKGTLKIQQSTQNLNQPLKAKSSQAISQQPYEQMAVQEIEQLQTMLLDPQYLKNKQIKKVSRATLQRRKTLIQNQNSKLGIQSSNNDIIEMRTFNDNSISQKNDIKKSSKIQLGQKKQANSIQELKNAYLHKKNIGQIQDDKFKLFNEEDNNGLNKGKNRANSIHQSIFSGKLNQGFKKQAGKLNERLQSNDQKNLIDDEFKITIVEGMRPDIEKIIELQRQAEEKYREDQNQLEKKYQGMTLREKKTLILQELEESQQQDKQKQQNMKNNDVNKKKETESQQRTKWQKQTNIQSPQESEQNIKNQYEDTINNNNVLIKMPQVKKKQSIDKDDHYSKTQQKVNKQNNFEMHISFGSEVFENQKKTKEQKKNQAIRPTEELNIFDDHKQQQINNINCLSYKDSEKQLSFEQNYQDDEFSLEKKQLNQTEINQLSLNNSQIQNKQTGFFSEEGDTLQEVIPNEQSEIKQEIQQHKFQIQNNLNQNYNQEVVPKEINLNITKYQTFLDEKNISEKKGNDNQNINYKKNSLQENIQTQQKSNAKQQQKDQEYSENNNNQYQFQQLKEQLNKFQNQQNLILESFENFQTTILMLGNKISQLENGFEQLKLQNNQLQTQINSQQNNQLQQAYKNSQILGTNSLNNLPLLQQIVSPISRQNTHQSNLNSMIQNDGASNNNIQALKQIQQQIEAQIQNQQFKSQIISNKSLSSSNSMTQHNTNFDIVQILLQQQQQQQQQQFSNNLNQQSNSTYDSLLQTLLLKKQIDQNNSQYE